MKVLPLIIVVLVHSSFAGANEIVRDRALIFGAAADDTCDELKSGEEESAALSAWAAKFAVNAVVGLASSFLAQSSEVSTVPRSANAPGFFYRWSTSEKSWIPKSGCVRFWYAYQRSSPMVEVDGLNYGVSPPGLEVEWKSLNARWAELSFTEQPYVYGELRISVQEFDNRFFIQPVVLFARRPPETSGFLRQTTRLLLAIDLRELGANSSVATHSLELPDVSTGAVLLLGPSATKGLASAWATMPAPPHEPAKLGESESGPFDALVTFTSTSDATLFGKTIAATINAQKDELAEALTPESKAQRAEHRRKSMVEAFESVEGVLEAQARLDAAEDGQRPKLLLALHKAQYLANLKLQAAGLPARYSVSGP